MSDSFYTAAKYGRAEALAAALDADAGLLERPGPDGWTALHLAAHFGHAGAVRLLLDRGADVHARAANEMRNTPLHAALAGARDADTVEALLAHGADVNAVAASGVTPLHLAAARGDLDLIDRLVALGATATAMDDGQTPAALAEARGHPEAAARLTGSL